VSKSFNFIDLCAGIGGLRIPFDELGGECVFTSEINRAARETYALNFWDGAKTSEQAEARINTDVVEIGDTRPHEVPDHDLLMAGFPCQPFSHAGKKLGFEDTRGTLFFSIANIIATKEPRVVLLENVRGLRSNDEGNTLRRILEVLRNPKPGLEYVVPEPKVLCARDFGLAQNRNRLFIVAIRKDVPGAEDFTFPISTHDRDQVFLKDFLIESDTAALTISDRLWQGHQIRKLRNTSEGKGFGYQLFNPETAKYVSTISARYFKDGSEALIEQPGKNPRKLSPEEIKLLQGFPANFKLNKSNVESYRQLGNAVPVSVIRAIAARLASYLQG
jgi:DNA (cytosine-5)-methyltransferase 1